MEPEANPTPLESLLNSTNEAERMPVTDIEVLTVQEQPPSPGVDTIEEDAEEAVQLHCCQGLQQWATYPDQWPDSSSGRALIREEVMQQTLI